MNVRLLLFSTVLLVGFAPAPFPRSEKPESRKDQMKKLQGEWVRTRTVIAGRVFPVTAVTMIIDGDRMTDTLAGTRQNTWTIRLDAGKTPKVFDIEMTTEGVKGTTFVGIYRLEGDTLTLCSRWSKAEKDRPKDFDGSKRGVWLEVFRRRP